LEIVTEKHLLAACASYIPTDSIKTLMDQCSWIYVAIMAWKYQHNI